MFGTTRSCEWRHFYSTLLQKNTWLSGSDLFMHCFSFMCARHSFNHRGSKDLGWRLRPRLSLLSLPSLPVICIFAPQPLCPVTLTTDRHLGDGFLGDGADEGFLPHCFDTVAVALSVKADFKDKPKPGDVCASQHVSKLRGRTRRALSGFGCKELKVRAAGTEIIC